MSDEGVAAGRLGGRGVGGTGTGRVGEAVAATAPATSAGGVGRHIGRIVGEVPRATSTPAASTGGTVGGYTACGIPLVRSANGNGNGIPLNKIPFNRIPFPFVSIK